MKRCQKLVDVGRRQFLRGGRLRDEFDIDHSVIQMESPTDKIPGGNADDTNRRCPDDMEV